MAPRKPAGLPALAPMNPRSDGILGGHGCLRSFPALYFDRSSDSVIAGLDRDPSPISLAFLKPGLFAPIGYGAHFILAVVRQAHCFGRNQLQDIASAKAPATADSIARNDAALGKLVDCLQMNLQKRRNL